MRGFPKMIHLTIALAAAALPLGSCRFMALDSLATPPLEQLDIGNADISNWTPQEKMKVYIGTELFTYNDGGAPQYLDKGCLKTGAQTMNKSDGSDVTVRSMVMDFGQDANAAAMFTEMQMNNVGKTQKDLVFPDSTAFVVPQQQGGVRGFAHFANFYFEISVIGYTDQLLAQKTFDMFLGLYARKLNR